MKKLLRTKRNRGLARRSMAEGMTYVELIVVLSIFSIMSSIVLFNYGEFQARVDIKNLASDIALKIVEAQKSSLNGLLPAQTPSVDNWKPSYGVYFDSDSADDVGAIPNVAKNKEFFYFVDLDQQGDFTNPGCSTDISECLTRILITKNNTISSLDKCNIGGCTSISTKVLTVMFKRPDSGAILIGEEIITGSDYAQITITSSRSDNINAKIKIYPSGRVQVN